MRTFTVTESLKARFFAKVEKRDDGCWIFKGAGRGPGYGAIKIEGRAFDAHRVAFIIENGRVPEGQLVCHKCDNPRCVNPDHLFLGTYSDNQADAIAKGRVVPFRKTRTDPLTDSEIESICDHYRRGISRRVVSKKFGVSPTSLDRVLIGAGLK